MPEREGSAGVPLAATVMLLRPANGGAPEVFMLKRSERSTFAPAAYVFPGGMLDPADMLPEALQRAAGLQPARVAAEFRAQQPRSLPSTERSPSPGEAAGLFIAALRELFEEAGILLATGAGGDAIDSKQWRELTPRLRAARERLRAGELTFTALLESLDLYADAHSLSLFSHWITPPTEPRRYNTHFFLARAPFDQAAFADATETHDERWITPRDALMQHRAGSLHLVYATLKHLDRLAEFDTLEGLFSYARAKSIMTIMPAPSENGYMLPSELENAW
jgi:8-oxo-dGTP pyrophosphatase MutT (NUDIX family)